VKPRERALDRMNAIRRQLSWGEPISPASEGGPTCASARGLAARQYRSGSGNASNNLAGVYALGRDLDFAGSSETFRRERCGQRAFSCQLDGMAT
jgi:hypothetical protein